MTYLLDTDTLIDCIVGIDDTRDQVLGFIERGDEVAVCAITVTELYSGMNDTRRATWEPWLRALPYWQISFEVAVQAYVIRMVREGRSMEDPYWTHNTFLFDGTFRYYRNRKCPVRGKLHVSEEQYDSFSGLERDYLTTTTGHRSYIHYPQNAALRHSAKPHHDHGTRPPSQTVRR